MDWTLLVAVFGYAFTVSKKCVQKYKKIKVSGYRHRAAGTSCKKKFGLQCQASYLWKLVTNSVCNETVYY